MSKDLERRVERLEEALYEVYWRGKRWGPTGGPLLGLKRIVDRRRSKWQAEGEAAKGKKDPSP